MSRSESYVATFWNCSSVRVGFNIFLITDATYWSKISSDHHRYFFAVSLTPFNFSGTLPLNKMIYTLMFSFSSIWDKTCFKNENIFVIQYYSKHNNRLGSSRQHRTLSGRGTYSCIHFDKKFDKKFNKIFKYKKMLNNKYIPGSQTLLLIYPIILNNKID